MTTIAPDDPRHGTTAGISAGCKCLPCKVARSTYRKHQNRQKAYGRWQPYVDAEPARTHLRHLSQHHGIGWEQAARLAGLPEATVGGLLYPRGRNKTKPAQRCRKSTHDAILAIQPSPDMLSDRSLVPGIGTQRRLRALVAIGYPMQHLGEQLPAHPEHVRRIIRLDCDTVTAVMHRAVRDLYRNLSGTPAPDTWVNRRARRLAADAGWVSPIYWDGDAIDDPHAIPETVEPEPIETVDWVLVGEVLRTPARWADLNRVERVALWRAWEHRRRSRGESVGLSAFATTFRVGKSTAERLRAAAATSYREAA